jgi:hypothetical protein
VTSFFAAEKETPACFETAFTTSSLRIDRANATAGSFSSRTPGSICRATSGLKESDAVVADFVVLRFDKT